jgi:hypothetical protein
MIDGVHYVNCGDWVESCTALIETLEGDLHVVRWQVHGPQDQPRLLLSADYAG